MPRATATLPSALRKNSDPFAESRSKMSRSRNQGGPDQGQVGGGVGVGGGGASGSGVPGDDYAYTDSCSIQ